jgi:hypothetical protein
MSLDDDDFLAEANRRRQGLVQGPTPATPPQRAGERPPGRNVYQPVPIYLGAAGGSPIFNGGGVPLGGSYGPDLTVNTVDEVLLTNASPAARALSANACYEEARAAFYGGGSMSLTANASQRLLQALDRAGLR